MNTLDAAEVLPDFAVGPLTVKRKDTGTYDKGRYVPAGTETTLIFYDCSLQPLRPREIQLLPENFRSREAVKIFSKDELRTADAVAGYEADRVQYKDKWYEVHSVEDWSEHGNFWKAVALKMGQ